jgi:hypothetical protein
MSSLNPLKETSMHYRFLFIIFFGLLTACAANVRNTDLLVSNTFLLPPVQEKTVFIQKRNASDNPQVTLSDLERRLTAKGYRVVKESQSARYIVFTNIVYCKQPDPNWPVDAMVSGGYGSKTTFELDGATGDIASRVLGSINKYLNGADVEGIVYACVADLQITYREKAGEDPAPRTTPGSPPPPGVYQLRVGATIIQKKFDEKEATQLVQQKLSAALAGYL